MLEAKKLLSENGSPTASLLHLTIFRIYTVSSKPKETRNFTDTINNSNLLQSDLVQIKPYKNRKKFELYIHNKPFKSLISDSNWLIPEEKLRSFTELKKKMIFDHFEYGKLLASICDGIKSVEGMQTASDQYQQQLQSLLAQEQISKFNNKATDILNKAVKNDDQDAKQTERLKIMYSLIHEALLELNKALIS